MKKLLCTILFLAIANLSFGWIWAEVEFHKSNLPTIQEMEHLRTLVPKEAKSANAAIAAVRQGSTNGYGVDLNFVTDTPNSQIASVEMILPDQTTLPCVDQGAFEYEGELLYEYEFDRGYFFFDELKTAFKPGDYKVRIKYKNRGPEDLNFTLPDYAEEDFLDLVPAELVWEGDTLKVNWSTVGGVDDDNYELGVWDVKWDDDVWEGDITLAHPNSTTTAFEEDWDNDAPEPGRDYGVGIEASYLFDDSGDVEVHFDSETELYTFKKVFPTFVDQITKCTVTAGVNNQDSIAFSGTLEAIEDDLLAAAQIVVTLTADDLPAPLEFEFPIDATTLKKGVFNSARTDNGAQLKFTYNTKTHKFIFTAKKTDLTGLACTFTVDITIGGFTSQLFELDEDIVNGAKKPCPPQLVQEIVDMLTVSKSTFKPGKTVGTDTLSVTGILTMAGTPDSLNESFVINLGRQTFTLPAGSFTSKKANIFTCKNALTQENNGYITATLDFNKCTYTLSIQKAVIESAGMTDFNLTPFRVTALSLPSGLPKINLGAMYSYWDLTQYDQNGKCWTYKTRAGSTDVSVNAFGGDEFEVLEEEWDAEASLSYTKHNGAAYFEQFMVDSEDLEGRITLDFDLNIWPSQMRLGQTCLSSSSMNGRLSALGHTIYITDGVASSKTVASPKIVRITTPVGPYDTIQFTETMTMKGNLDYQGDYVGTISFTIIQTNYAAPGVGVVKRTRTFKMTARIPGAGSISDTLSEVYLLSDM